MPAGPDPSHGTGVSGLIAAVRGNALGIDGVAPNEPGRTVVRIINMSFAKRYSPGKSAVDEAVAYAVARGVLLVHVAGNDSRDIGEGFSFPTRHYADGIEATTWLEVGASTADGAALAAPFSNYNASLVDLFAPGANVTVLTPGGGARPGDGTSYAGPVVSGVAALLMAYFPELTTAEVRQIILDSVTRHDIETPRPGSEDTVAFATLSATGGVVNAAEAVRLAIGRSATR